jgi:hypothetical protein
MGEAKNTVVVHVIALMYRICDLYIRTSDLGEPVSHHWPNAAQPRALYAAQTGAGQRPLISRE